ncbi:hypothetical protein Psuf_035390 [Phytohabitans suffuscus]|uniref:Uncharacterized protein n=1 Tax=Phytohabitans suffuscus TaxID=624315 RepID=A0A6F8YJG7_9ACTN|nr:hypothetical protein Psuf_035390 [Phytohabitans suffuscus]
MGTSCGLRVTAKSSASNPSRTTMVAAQSSGDPIDSNTPPDPSSDTRQRPRSPSPTEVPAGARPEGGVAGPY